MLKKVINNLMFCLIVPIISMFFICVLCLVILISLPMYFVFWLNPVFEIYQIIIWKFYNLIFQITNDDTTINDINNDINNDNYIYDDIYNSMYDEKYML